MKTEAATREIKISPRQELGRFADNGDLRYTLQRSTGAKLSDEAINLCVNVVGRYCDTTSCRALRSK